MPRVGVVVLNWNSAWFTKRCLQSIAATDYPVERLRVVLVDNGSVDGSLEQIESWLSRPGSPTVELLRTGSNLGFAEGCNRATRELLAGGPECVEHVALINNDAWVEPGWLRAMVDVMADNPACAAVSARLLLEPGFFAVDIEAGARAETVESVELCQGSVPMAVGDRIRTHGLTDEGALVWPPRRIWRLAPGRSGRIWVPAGPGDGSLEMTLVDDRGAERTVNRDLGVERTRLLNGLGTGLNESGEGYDIGYAEPEEVVLGSAGTESRVVDGFCGGAALMRAEALTDVGLFDPAFFAYYEDTDLSWRLRNAGWEVRTAPDAVVHHAFGASGGGGSRWHVFLDRRNWLVTNFRNGDRVARRRALGWLWRGSWRLFRVNVFGRLRRGEPMQVEPLRTWKLAALCALARTVRLRADPTPGAHRTDRVRGRFQPSGSPRAPEPWPGGPLVVYLDVGETLKAGYRAGVQRVVCALVAELPDVDPRIELVPIRWCPRNERFRRITSQEYASLLRSGEAVEMVEEPAAVASAKQFMRSAFGAIGVLDMVRRRREQVFGRDQRALEDSLVIERLAAGAVLFEVDAVWNELELDRDELLSRVRADGVHVASFVHDLLPLERPEWFSAHLRDIFVPAALAQLRHSELLLCASDATAIQLVTVSEREAIDPSPSVVVPLSGVRAPTAGAPAPLPPALEGARYLLVVGTLEPRKNQALALEVFDRLAAEFPDLHLVLAGRFGWGVSDLVTTLGAHPLRGRRVHWLTDVHDEELEALYRDAFLVLVPSFSEGFGLPAVEALSRGVPVLATQGGTIAEVAGGSASYADPSDPQAWVDAVRSMLRDPEARAVALSRTASFEPTNWSETAAGVCEALLEAFAPFEVRISG